ncbi:MAG: hypothetical protein LBI63_03715 [Candidatus Ancillula sp.]|jgi:hypothetical protein|nr:hypothetical protein [Candidatus Ancillula sp.]
MIRNTLNKTKCLVGTPLLLLIIMVSFAGCSTNSKQDGQIISEGGQVGLTPEKSREEYKKEAESLELPAGFSWPDASKKIPEKFDDGKGIYYGIGNGTEEADHVYFCSWAKVYLKSTDETLKQKALSSIDFWKTLPEYTTFYDENTRKIADKEINDAKLGDLTGLQRDISLNCDSSDAN